MSKRFGEDPDSGDERESVEVVRGDSKDSALENEDKRSTKGLFFHIVI